MNLRETEAQRLGRNKRTKVVQSVIDEGEYRRKFDDITSNKEVNRLLYYCAKKILEHRKGTLLEDMYWIDPNASKIVAAELSQMAEKCIVYSKRTKRLVRKNKGLITIHNHPDGFPPSVDDFNSNYKNNYSLGVVCGHNGKIFMYSSETEISERYFGQKVAYYKKKGYNDYDAQLETIKTLSKLHNIKCKEVSL